MIEVNPFTPFIPAKTKYLILGSFPGKLAGQKSSGYDWYYGSTTNHFWKILRNVYGLEMGTKEEKQRLFTKLGMAITDIIFSCERKQNNNSDTNLVKITYNVEPIVKLFKTNIIEKIYFTSKFVEKEFQRRCLKYIEIKKDIKFIILPSPSPRYARMNITEKTKIYKKLLPKNV